METLLIQESDLTPQTLEILISALNKDEIIAIPTETVYGLAVSANNPAALEKLYELKNRPQQKAFVLHISSFDSLSAYVQDLPKEFFLLAEHFLPGPLSLVVKKSAASEETIAIRMPSDPTAKKFIDAAGGAVLATSANISSQPCLLTAKEIFQTFSGKIFAVIDSGESPLKIASTILSLAESSPKILRQGSITKEALEKALNKIILA
jgi:L-threonylcarbamoyladenylate synthase